MRRLVSQVCLVFLMSSACGEDPSRNEVTDPGRGPENVVRLDDLHTASYAALASGKGRRVEGLVDWDGLPVIRVTYEDPSLPVEIISQRNFLPGWPERLEDHLYRLGTLEGGPTRHRTLMVPDRVREGMKWVARANGGDSVTASFEVVERRLLHGPRGEAPAWHIRERSGRTIDRVYVEGWGFVGIGTLDDVDELLQYEHSRGGGMWPMRSAPAIPLEGEGLPLLYEGLPLRLTHGAVFQLLKEGETSLYVEGECGDTPCQLCLAVGPQVESLRASTCPARLAGQVAVIRGVDGPTFAVAEEAEVVRPLAIGSAQALRRAEVGIEARLLSAGDKRKLVGGWDSVLGTDLDHGLRWSEGKTVFLAGRVSVAKSEVGAAAVEQPTLIGTFDGTLHGSVGPDGHGVLHTSVDGMISRFAESEGHHVLIDLGILELPAGHRLAGAWPVADGRAVVITTSGLASFLWTAELPIKGRQQFFHQGAIGRADGDDLVACVVDRYNRVHEQLVPEQNRCVVSAADDDRRGTPAARLFADRSLEFLAASSGGEKDTPSLQPGTASFFGGFVSPTHLFRRSGVFLGAPEGAHTIGLAGDGVPDVGGGLWIPFVEPEEAGGRAGLVYLGREFKQFVMGQGEAPQILFQISTGGLVVSHQGKRFVVSSLNGPTELRRSIRERKQEITMGGYEPGPSLCGTLKRPTEKDLDMFSTYAFCENQSGGPWQEELELGIDVELRGIEGEAWTPIQGGFLAVREERGARELVVVQQRREDRGHGAMHVVDVTSAPMELRTFAGRQYPRAFFHTFGSELWMVHIDEEGQEFVAVLAGRSFRPMPYRVEGAQRIEAVFRSDEFTFLRVVMGETCDPSGCVEDVRVVRFP